VIELDIAEWPHEVTPDATAVGLILSIAADAIILLDSAQHILQFNRGAEEIFGYTAKDVLGKPLSMLIPERFHHAHDEHVRAFAHGAAPARRMGERREIFGIRASGQEFPAEASIAKLSTPGGMLFMVVLRDITDRQREEEHERLLATLSDALAHSLEYETTVCTAAEGPLPKLADTCILTVFEGPDRTLRRVRGTSTDPEMLRVFRTLEGYETDLWTRPLKWRGPAPDATTELIEQVQLEWLALNVLTKPAYELMAALRMQSVIIVPLIARDHVNGVMTLIRTVGSTPYTKDDIGIAEAVAHRAAFAIDNALLYRAARRATRARDDVLGVVSHDLRNPISTIEMLARVLTDTPPADDIARRELARAITTASEWAGRLIQDLLDVAMIEAGRLSVHRDLEDVAPIVVGAVELVRGAAAGKSIVIELDVSGNLPRVFVDAGRIRQLLGNLLSNAVKFTPTLGKITISARVVKREVIIAVTDTGPGIPAEHLPLVFERYWRALHGVKANGAGLGLAIAKGIADANSGRLWVETQPAGGAKFSLALSIGT